jgi:FMN reductase
LFTGVDLQLPHYDPRSEERSASARALVASLRRADGLFLASPGYHGSISGLVKNALDYVEDMRKDSRCYLTDIPVGCIVAAAGWQAGGATLIALRSIVHSLRGWPTPLGVVFNSTTPAFQSDGVCVDEVLERNLGEMTKQVVKMARLQLQSVTPALA